MPSPTIGWRTPTGLRRSVAAIVVVIMAGVTLASDARLPKLDSAPQETADWPGWGFTHTQYSADVGAPSAIRSVERALAAQPLVQAQAIMGWGAENPEPRPDSFDFTSLDSRIQFIRRSGGIPVITLCCAPDWMKGAAAGATDWRRLTEAPLRRHFPDFAALAAVVAERYPDVHHFMVWNELKGFWDEEDNTWDAVGYTDLYNQVYDAVTRVNPTAQIGGPYISLMSDQNPSRSRRAIDEEVPGLRGPWGSVDHRGLAALEHWLAHKHGADFVVVDGHATVEGRTADPFAAMGMFGAVNTWIQERTDLPIWWAEWYLDPAVDRWPAERQMAAYTVAMMQFVRTGTRTALYWNPQPGGSDCATCLWTDTGENDGGRPLALLTEVLQNFARWFPPGTHVRSTPAPPGVQVLVQDRVVLAVNTTNSRQTFRTDGTRISLSPYEVRWVTAA